MNESTQHPPGVGTEWRELVRGLQLLLDSCAAGSQPSFELAQRVAELEEKLGV
jgi:hypothetical protein